jgi:drug/metabolite transporter (DMT)-like permease
MKVRLKVLTADGLLLLTAMIWGLAFVFQRIGMAYVGPFSYSAARFSLGVAVLLPFAVLSRRKGWFVGRQSSLETKTYLAGGCLAGLALFFGISFQQVGIVYTTAGKAGFITGLYVVIVPLMGLLWHSRTTVGTWLGAVLAASGLYLLSVTTDLKIAYGDALVLSGAFVWAAHVHILARVAPGSDPLILAVVQYMTCALLSWICAWSMETVQWASMVKASTAILYGGVLSVGLAYTLQVVAQRKAHPAHVAILLSLESVFAALSGWLMLQETLSFRALMGCALMLVGMLVSQLYTTRFTR